MKPRRYLFASAAVAAAFSVTPVHAGVIDSPAPTLSGQTSYVLYVIPGVTRNNNLETEVICTNLDTVTGRVGVELFASGQPLEPSAATPLNDVSTGNGAQDVPVGGTVTIGTSNTLGFHEDEVITGLTNVKGGVGRVVSTVRRLACTALLVDKLTDPPTSMVSLKVLAKKRQVGD